jgi:spoIIIJ-associated protein
MSQDAAAVAKLRLEELLTFFGINTTVEVTEQDDHIELQVPAADAGHLIGYHGETLRAIQYVINTIVRQQVGERNFISVDIAGYKQARAEALAEQAKAAAEKVIADGEEHEMRPMNAAERRMVHMALADDDRVFTESIGEGTSRRLVIKRKDA